MKEGYRDIDEILKEVGEEENIPFREMRDIWRHQQRYIKKQMDNDEVTSIFIPYVGILSLNVKHFAREIRNKVREPFKKIIDKINRLIKHEKYTKTRNAHKKTTGVHRLTRHIISRYKTGYGKAKMKLTYKKCLEIISNHSNNKYDKRDKPLKRKMKK